MKAETLVYLIVFGGGAPIWAVTGVFLKNWFVGLGAYLGLIALCAIFIVRHYDPEDQVKFGRTTRIIVATIMESAGVMMIVFGFLELAIKHNALGACILYVVGTALPVSAIMFVENEETLL